MVLVGLQDGRGKRQAMTRPSAINSWDSFASRSAIYGRKNNVILILCNIPLPIQPWKGKYTGELADLGQYLFSRQEYQPLTIKIYPFNFLCMYTFCKFITALITQYYMNLPPFTWIMWHYLGVCSTFIPPHESECCCCCRDILSLKSAKKWWCDFSALFFFSICASPQCQ